MNPNSDKSKPNWNRKDAKVAKIYFFFAFFASSRFEKIFAFCATISLDRHYMLDLVSATSA